MNEIENTIPSEEHQTQAEKGIPQHRIMELLQEASTLARIKGPQAKQRIAGIQDELMEASGLEDLEYSDQEIDVLQPLAYNQKISVLVNELFVDAVQNSPESVPTLFPVFAAISGKRVGRNFANVDWSIAKQPSPQQTIGEVKRMLGPNSTPNASPQPPSGTSQAGR